MLKHEYLSLSVSVEMNPGPGVEATPRDLSTRPKLLASSLPLFEPVDRLLRVHHGFKYPHLNSVSQVLSINQFTFERFLDYGRACQFGCSPCSLRLRDPWTTLRLGKRTRQSSARIPVNSTVNHLARATDETLNVQRHASPTSYQDVRH